MKDNVTGLYWEVKHGADGSPDYGNPNDADNTYTWYDSTAAVQGEQGDGITTFDTQQFIQALNDANFGGFNDWRMPTREELRSIADYSSPNPSIDTGYFPNTVSSYYWSSRTGASNASSAWGVNFYYGDDYNNYKSYSRYVRAVRGGQSRSLDHWVINGDGTVTDKSTGLMWEQKTDDGGERDKDNTYTWTQAIDYCELLPLAGHTDWRLPTIKELASIADLGRYNPAIDTIYFPNCVSSLYWSSSTYADNTNYAWGVNFSHGYDVSYSKSYSRYVRAVRGGQPRPLDHLVIQSPARASKWQTGGNMTIQWDDPAGIGGSVNISISYEGGKPGTYQTIAASTPNDGAFTWAIPHIPSFNCMLKIEPLSDPNKRTAQGLFTIGRFIQTDPPDLVLTEPTTPAGGESKTFQLSIPDPPSGEAVFNLHASNPTECTVSPATVALNAGNYATGATVTVTSTYDGVRDGEQRAFVLVTTADDNAGFHAKDAPVMTVTVRDAQTGTTLTSVYPAYLPANSSAVAFLRGQGFSAATRVYIYPDGGTPAEITPDKVIDDTTLKITLPAKSAGSYHLKAGADELPHAVKYAEAAPFQTQSRRKAIIVAGGGPRADNSLWNAAEKCTRNAYRTLAFQGYSADNIKFFSGRLWDDATGDGANDIDGDATSSNLQNALTSWAVTGTDELLLYIVAPSGDKTVQLGGGDAPDTLTAAALDGWLDTLQASIAGPVVVILDACLSGSFLQPLAAENRVVVASARSDERAWFLDDGELSFSHHLFDRLFHDPDFYTAFTAAKALATTEQTPLIDIDGDGSPDDPEDKFSDVASPQVGDKEPTDTAPPLIEAWATPDALPAGGNLSTATLGASIESADHGVGTVWARITPPGASYGPVDEPGIVKDAYRLLETTGVYEHERSDYDLHGVYKFEVYAYDLEDSISNVVPLTLTQGEGVLTGDMNDDKQVTLADAIFVLRIMAGEPLSPKPENDHDQDGKVELADAIFILQMVAELRE